MASSPATLDASATTPPGEVEITYNATEARNSSLVTLADLCAKGTSHYAHRQYEEAADFYAQASELQAEINGEMDPANAEVLFLYGRSLFRVGQGKSDVLGGRAGGEKKKKEGNKEGKKEKVVAEEDVKEEAEGGKAEEKKPLFQFTGDENFEDSDDEDAEDGSGGEEDEDDELATAFEVLDLARVLFTRKLEGPEEGTEAETAPADGADKGKGKAVGDSLITRHIKERLADTHDLLAEISLENERFPNAVDDFRAALAYKNELHPQASEVVAEAHYKLSLALEFASITTTGDADAEEGGKGEAHVDEAMREEAAGELQRAIDSTRLKLAAKEVQLAQTASPEENEVTRAQIAEVREIVADMEQRLVDLRAPPVDINAAINGPAATGGFGAAALEAATRGATDLSGMVRKKGKKGENGEGKRKAEGGCEGGEEEAKKARNGGGA